MSSHVTEKNSSLATRMVDIKKNNLVQKQNIKK